MSPTLPDRLADVHPKMLRADSQRGESDRKKFVVSREAIGHLIERALELAGVTKQDAAFQMGYRDSAVVSRWCSALERPLFDKLFVVDGFIEAFVVALAERHPDISAETVVRIRRRA